MRTCARVDANPEKTTTKRISVKVVGDVDLTVVRLRAGLSKMAQDVFTPCVMGPDIELMGEVPSSAVLYHAAD